MRRVLSPFPNVTDEVGELLRQHYDEVLHEPVPLRLLALLERLEMDGALLHESRESLHALRHCLRRLDPRLVEPKL